MTSDHVNDTRVVAVISAVQPDPGDRMCSGESVTAKVEHFVTQDAAMRWVKRQLAQGVPVPHGTIATYGYCYLEEYDPGCFCWFTVEESDIIQPEDTLPTKWFTV